MDWVLQINIQSIMDQLIDKDRVGPMIVVMPSIDPHHGLQDCVDAPGASETALREVGFDIIKTGNRASCSTDQCGTTCFTPDTM